jgi:hypothetical protein
LAGVAPRPLGADAAPLMSRKATGPGRVETEETRMLATIERGMSVEAVIEANVAAHLADGETRNAAMATDYSALFDRIVDAGVSAAATTARAIEDETQQAVFAALASGDPAVFALHRREEAGFYALTDALELFRDVQTTLQTVPAGVVRDLLEALRETPVEALNVLAGVT